MGDRLRNSILEYKIISLGISGYNSGQNFIRHDKFSEKDTRRNQKHDFTRNICPLFDNFRQLDKFILCHKPFHSLRVIGSQNSPQGKLFKHNETDQKLLPRTSLMDLKGNKKAFQSNNSRPLGNSLCFIVNYFEHVCGLGGVPAW